jgi:hypothetical protein
VPDDDVARRPDYASHAARFENYMVIAPKSNQEISDQELSPSRFAIMAVGVPILAPIAFLIFNDLAYFSSHKA